MADLVGSDCSHPARGADDDAGRSGAARSRTTRDTVAESSLAAELARLALAFEQDGDLQATLDAIVHGARSTIAGADHVSISAVRGRREVCTLASTGELAITVDHAQYATGQGPCLDTLFEHHTVQMDDVREEDRWPAFVERVAGSGLRSMLTVQLYVDGDRLGALNIHSTRPHAFDETSKQAALLLAPHAAVAMAGAQRQAQLREALGTRGLVGQAMGILMERYGITGDRAFGVLGRLSQDSNRKVSDLAAHLVEHGRLPGEGRARHGAESAAAAQPRAGAPSRGQV